MFSLFLTDEFLIRMITYILGERKYKSALQSYLQNGYVVMIIKNTFSVTKKKKDKKWHALISILKF